MNYTERQLVARFVDSAISKPMKPQEESKSSTNYIYKLAANCIYKLATTFTNCAPPCKDFDAAALWANYEIAARIGTYILIGIFVCFLLLDDDNLG